MTQRRIVFGHDVIESRVIRDTDREEPHILQKVMSPAFLATLKPQQTRGERRIFRDDEKKGDPPSIDPPHGNGTQHSVQPRRVI